MWYFVVIFTFLSTSIFAQYRLDIIDGGVIEGGNDYRRKEVNFEERGSAIVVIQSTTALSYELVPKDAIPDEDISSIVDSDGIYVDSIYFFVNDMDSRVRLTIYAKGYPSELLELNMMESNTYNYMVMEPEGASTEVEESADVEESAESLITVGDLALSSSQYPYAEEVYGRALTYAETPEIYAKLALAHYRQAGVYSGRSHYPKAIEFAGKALDLDPDNYIANIVMGLSLRYQASYKYRSITRDSNYKANVELRNDMYRDVIKHLTHAISLGEQSPYVDFDLDYELGVSNYMLRDYPTALSLFEKSYKLTNSSESLRMMDVTKEYIR